eukprot:441002-Rhodomonas_salina.1
MRVHACAPGAGAAGAGGVQRDVEAPLRLVLEHHQLVAALPHTHTSAPLKTPPPTPCTLHLASHCLLYTSDAADDM